MGEWKWYGPGMVAVLLLVWATGCSTHDTSRTGEEEVQTIRSPVVDTGQVLHYDNEREMAAPGPDTNRDGVVDYQDKMTPDEAAVWAASLVLGGHSDWRVPSITELYSLILFSGCDVPSDALTINPPTPFIDMRFFGFAYGDVGAGERIIDAQYLSATHYVGTTMNGQATVFGVNFADGRIKGYPAEPLPGQSVGKRFYVRVVRGANMSRGPYRDNGDGTVSDTGSALMWMKADSQVPLLWREALDWAESYEGSGYSDWRLPNAKELQGLVDYSRAPGVTGSAAIDPVFDVTPLINEGGEGDFPWYWTGTTHVNSSLQPGGAAVYICFGRAMGFMNGRWVDVHGAGAQRSDPKVGDPADFPQGFGPQGDAVRIRNFARLVRDEEG